MPTTYTSFTNADKIGAITANSNTSPMVGYNSNGMKGILNLNSNQYKNITSINAQYLGIRDVYFLDRKIFQGNIYTGITPPGLNYLNLTSNALTTDAIDGILISMEENAKKNKIKNGEIYLWGGSSGWNQFPSEKGYAARKQLMEPASPKFSGIFSLSGTAAATGAFFLLDGVVNYFSFTGANLSGNILSIVNKSPPFQDINSTYTVQPLTNNRCLFIKNSETTVNSTNFFFGISGATGSNTVLSGSFSILGSGGKFYGDWRVGVNRWVEAFYGQGEARTIPSNGVNSINIVSDILNKKYICTLKPNQTMNIGLINYGSRGVSNVSYNARIEILDAAVLNTNISSTYLSYILARRIIGPERADNCIGSFAQFFNGTIGQWSYGQGGGLIYETTDENYRYSGCPIHSNSVTCPNTLPYGGVNSASLLSPYPFDGNTVVCPIDCITNNFNKDVVIFFHGATTCFTPATVFFDDSIAFNIQTYPNGNCGATLGSSSLGVGNCITNKFSVIDPNQGKVCSERAISRDHARII